MMKCQLKNGVYSILLIGFAAILMGCQQTKVEASAVSNAITEPSFSLLQLYDIKGKLIVEVKDPAILAKLYQSWLHKKQVIYKRQPDFKYRVVVFEGEESQTWLYASGGLVLQQQKVVGNIYQLSNENILQSYLE